LTEGLTQKHLRGYVQNALEILGDTADEIFPQAFLEERGMPGVSEALREAHFPTSEEARDAARRRLAYEELFVFQTALASLRQRAQQQPGVAFRIGPNVDRRIRKLFTFPFTQAQGRCIEQVREDMRAPRPMNRLLQGDVGCGKTAVAIYAMLAALADSGQGYQAALMAPTEILAEQHYLKLRTMLGNARVRMALLKGAAGAAARREGLAALAAGEIDLVVGTHALIQDDVEFRNLAMVVVDEQHRFGVRQRLALRRKGLPPDVLIMTATPIPRTLALTYFADVDVSVIDEMPPGRSAVTTELLPPARWPQAFQAARAELQKGNRVFVVYPLVEENADLDLTSAQEGFEELRRHTFPDFDCCLLHGQMKGEQKQAMMEGFRTGKFQVMAATTVVEVGIDVPEATVMIIQHAERLGLAQLHQLRGRIGRGQWPGRCYLLADPQAPEAQQRLSVLTETNDGFKIAEEDLRLRGPGQILGTRQSGLPDLTCYDFRDTRVLERAQADARAMIAADPELIDAEHAKLRERMLARYGTHFEHISAG
jgi:ATP-dependent DNA helicase RecG